MSVMKQNNVLIGIIICCFLAVSCKAQNDVSNRFASGQSLRSSERVEVEVPKNNDSRHKKFWDQFFTGLSASLYVIIISELGDKTFFIAAIMSMQHSRWLVYAGAMGALATMTVLSAILGYATTVVPRKWTFYTSGVLFLIFGLKMIYDAYKMSPNDVQEEYEEVKMQLSNSVDPEVGRSQSTSKQTAFHNNIRNSLRRVLSPVLAEAFILTFLAEWGDRSQITTIVLAATKEICPKSCVSPDWFPCSLDHVSCRVPPVSLWAVSWAIWLVLVWPCSWVDLLLNEFLSNGSHTWAESHSCFSPCSHSSVIRTEYSPSIRLINVVPRTPVYSRPHTCRTPPAHSILARSSRRPCDMRTTIPLCYFVFLSFFPAPFSDLLKPACSLITHT